MPYLGNEPATQFTDLKYQDLTGGSGTSFTLDYAVGNAQAIEVFVNNVRQEPGVAYTVSGTGLTMTGTIASTDDFYVIFQGMVTSTATHPATSNLEAADGTFTGDLTVDTNTLYVDSTNNRVGIGTSSPATSLDISQTTLDSVIKIDAGVDAFMGFGSNATATQNWHIGTVDSDSSFRFYNGNYGAGTERMRILSSGGITFNGDTAAANALNDYEEGSFVPTVTTSTSVDYTSSNLGAVYTKVGNLVTFQLYITWTNNTNNTSAKFEIGGLPFDSIAKYGSCNIGYVGGANMNDAIAVIQESGDYIYFHQNDGTSSTITNADVHTRSLTTIILTGSYFTNS